MANLQGNIAKIKVGLQVPIDLRQPYDNNILIQSLNTSGVLENYNVNLFSLASYFYDGYFNIMKLPKGLSFYHGSWKLAKALAFMPLGRNYFSTLYSNGPSLPEILDSGIVFKQSEKFWEKLSTYGSPIPSWMSFLSVANLYSKRQNYQLPDGSLAYNDVIECNNLKTVYLSGQQIQARKCVLAFETTREINLVLLEDVVNITKILTSINQLQQNDWVELIAVLNETENANPGYFVINSIETFRKAISLVCFGPTEFPPNNARINFNNIGVRSINSGVDKFGGQFEFYDTQNNARVSFNRVSHYNYDITTGIALCWLINKIRTNYYDGMGNSWSWRPDVVNNAALRTSLKGLPDYHHPELFLCNASACLKRQYENPVDWQYQNYEILPPLTKKHFKSIDKVLFNYKTYKGDLIDISIWTSLITQALLGYQTGNVPLPTNFPNFSQDDINLLTYLRSFLTSQIDIALCILSSFFITNKLKYFYCTKYNCVISLSNNELGIHNYILDTSNNITLDLYKEIMDPRFGTANEERNHLTIVYVINMTMVILNNTNNVNTVQKLISLYFAMVYLPNTDINVYNDIENVNNFKKLVSMASIIAISFVLQRLGPTVLSSNNIKNYISPIFDFMINRSQRYPGKTDQDNLQSLSIIMGVIKNIWLELNKYVTSFPKNIMDITIQENANIYSNINIFKMSLHKFIPQQNHDKYKVFREDVRIEIEKLRPGYVQHIDQQVLGSFIQVDLGSFYNKEPQNFWKLLSVAEYYSPLIKNLELQLNKRFQYFTSFKQSQVLQSQKSYSSIINTVLDLTKPIYELISKYYVSHGYPIFITNPPRYNHNILNFLRSLYFANVFLTQSSFAQNKNLQPIDVLCIQLSSFLKSSGRLNEDSGNINKQAFSVGTLMNILGITNNNNIINDINTVVNLNPLQIVTMCISKSILESIQVTEINTSKYYDYVILGLGISPDDHNIQAFHEDFQEFTKIISIGHYLDHCRPTTGYSQIDTVGSGDGLGPLWLKQILNQYKLERTWDETKKIYHQAQIDEISKSGFKFVGGKYDISESHNDRCVGLFENTLSPRFIDLTNNFSLAWEELIVNSV
tara:strand:- start:5141 stop:8407 length:3267 start_codon:yes stop_codon:yes gene_type:complete